MQHVRPKRQQPQLRQLLQQTQQQHQQQHQQHQQHEQQSESQRAQRHQPQQQVTQQSLLGQGVHKLMRSKMPAQPHMPHAEQIQDFLQSYRQQQQQQQHGKQQEQHQQERSEESTRTVQHTLEQNVLNCLNQSFRQPPLSDEQIQKRKSQQHPTQKARQPVSALHWSPNDLQVKVQQLYHEHVGQDSIGTNEDQNVPVALQSSLSRGSHASKSSYSGVCPPVPAEYQQYQAWDEQQNQNTDLMGVALRAAQEAAMQAAGKAAQQGQCRQLKELHRRQ